MTIFASTYPYALIKVARALGQIDGGSEAEFALIREEQSRLGESSWPAFRTLGELQHVEPAMVVCDASGSIAQSRSRMAGRYLAAVKGHPELDVWLTLDDDVFAERAVLARVIEAARSSRAIASVPYLLRDGRTASVAGLQRGGEGFLAASSGLGLVAMHRDAVERIAEAEGAPLVDDKGMRYPGIFRELVRDGVSWLGEDISFCVRAAAAGVPLHVLTDAPVCHAGRWSRLEPDGTFAVDRATAAGIRAAE